jgi:hypothetical protein
LPDQLSSLKINLQPGIIRAHADRPVEAKRVVANGAFPHQRVISKDLISAPFISARSVWVSPERREGVVELRRGLMFWYP